MRKLFTFKYARIVYGIIILIIGAMSMVLPMIPLGYIGLFVGSYLLHHRVPPLRRVMDWLREKDKKGRLQRFENWVDHLFNPPEEEEQQ
jgi:hypothetical protein